MAAALPLLSIGMGLFSAASQVSAGKDAQAAGRANASDIMGQNAEERRRMMTQQLEVESRGRAAAAASGTGFGPSSQTSFLDKMKQEHKSELQWLRRSGESQAKAAIRSGNQASNQATASAIGTLASTATSAYSFFGPKG